jgi:tRNA (guanine-N1)-methyltransferase
LCIADAIIRLLPGVLNDEQSALTDSFQDDLFLHQFIQNQRFIKE